MKTRTLFPVAAIAAAVLAGGDRLWSANAPAPGKSTALFDGKTLAGWEGKAGLWRVEDGFLTGGSWSETVARNEFLATTRDYTNFIVRLQIKLTGTNGFINSGIQIRSQRVPNNSEMAGYQCDYGEPDWYGAVYDESRRNRVLSPSDMQSLGPVLRRQDWNDYVIRADGPRVTTWINGVMGTDYREADPTIPDWGKIGIQVHGGGRALVQVRNITIEELPATPPNRIFRGAPEPKKSGDNSASDRATAQTANSAQPLSPAEEKARFTVALGFTIDLIAAEDMDSGVGKFVAVDWDQHGNLWTMTAFEYPVDGNENPAAARELYASKARDKVLVYGKDSKSPTGYATTPRVFADGLAIPLGILPYKNGVYVQHGTEIVFLSDTDGDGRADKREVILSGFGVQDSHLFPHQFTRAPGGWIWFAQGAFNYGKVKTTGGAEVQFDQTRMAKFRPDGGDFQITSQGPCNIWGLFMTMEGEAWIQEANDYGYPAMPFHEYANYPGCSQAQWKSYAPEFPGTAPHFQMGGTGLSGLAITDAFHGEGPATKPETRNQKPETAAEGWPEAYSDVIYIANPITRKIQAIKADRDGPRYTLTKLPDFIQSSDEMFRPVALRLGPDGCLYFVDWYNKIISHNEVPRNHPERDKKRGRIWRVRPSEFKPLDVPDFAKLSENELVACLGGPNTTQSHLAWQAIGDRRLRGVAPKLREIITDRSQSGSRRIAALWALEGLGTVEPGWFQPLLAEPNRNLRREAVRMFESAGILPGTKLALLEPLATDQDPEVRAEVIRVAAHVVTTAMNAADSAVPADAVAAVALCARFARPSLDAPTMKSTQNGRIIKTGVAYEREFERYLVRLLLEREPAAVSAFLDSPASKSLPVDNRLLLALALEPRTSAARVAKLLSGLTRPPGQEEVLRLAQFPDEPGAGDALKEILQKPGISSAAIESLLSVRTKFDANQIAPLLNEAARQLLTQSNPESLALGTRLAGSFQLAAVEPELVRVLEQGWAGYPKLDTNEYLLRPESLAALQALRELRSDRVDLFAVLVEKGGPAEQLVAVGTLAASRDLRGPERLGSLYSGLSVAPRRVALAALTVTKAGANAVVKSVRAGAIPRDELDGAALDRLQALLGDDAELAVLLNEMNSLLHPVLWLDGRDASYVDSKITLTGAFTVETWVKLDDDISNRDGILGGPGSADFNFANGVFRIWCGQGLGDRLIAKKKMIPNIWTHLTVTRGTHGDFRLYWNGELDSTDARAVTNTFSNLDIGRTIPADAGTAGWLGEFRIWDRERTAEEIRRDFDRSFEGETRPAGLVSSMTNGESWGPLHGGAKVVRTADYPPVTSPAEVRELAGKFDRIRSLAGRGGDLARGDRLFQTACRGCHSVGGKGGQVGPVLNGAGASGTEALLRNIITPSAAMEAGYRVYRVELKDGEIVDGIMVAQDADVVILRRPNLEDVRIPLRDARRAGFTKRSMMPDGLLDGMNDEDVSDLFAFLGTLR